VDVWIQKMIRVQSHRGPDGTGSWTSRVDHLRVALGSVRLAILDLTAAGSQPMFSPSQRQVLVYNGEVYNYRELREELQGRGVVFRTRCDTEVVLQALATWGEGALERFNGMWSLAWLDRDAGRLVLSRDPLGIKPLYWHTADGCLFFASEIKGILAARDTRFSINPEVVARFLRQSLLDAQQQTFFAGIEAVPPGHVIRFDLFSPPQLQPALRRFWTPPDPDRQIDGSAPNADEARSELMDSVRLRLRSDVPVGVLLSGGVDSSALAAAMRHSVDNGNELQLLSIVCDDRRYSEEPFIDRMATHLGKAARSTRVRFTAHDAFRLLDRTIWHNDEPFGCFSPVGHYLLMQRARELGVTVILSGQGADELACGYLKYWGFYLQSLVHSREWGRALTVAAGVALRGTFLPHFRINEAKRYLPRWLGPRGVDICGRRLHWVDSSLDMGLGTAGLVERQVADLAWFSLPSLLHYEDRMSMAFGREIRLPYLDGRVISRLLPLHPRWKLRRGWSKWILRKAMEVDLPSAITWRKDKQGFANPQSEWLKNELRPSVERLFSEPMLTAAAGLVDQAALRRVYSAYCRQRGDGGPISFKDIFNPLALELWARRFEPSLRLEP